MGSDFVPVCKEEPLLGSKIADWGFPLPFVSRIWVLDCFID